MRARRVRVGQRGRGAPALGGLGEQGAEAVERGHTLLRETHDVDLLLGVLTHGQRLGRVAREQVENLAAVDLEGGGVEAEQGVLRLLKHGEDVGRGEYVEARLIV